MLVTRVLVTCLIAFPILAAPRAVVLGVWGTVPQAPNTEMTTAWRESAASVTAYEWASLDKTIEELRKKPGCAKMGPACRARIGRELKVKHLFFARHFPWGVAFEQIAVETGTRLRKVKIPMTETGEALVARFKEIGIKFVVKSAPEPAPGEAPVAAVVPAPSPAKAAPKDKPPAAEKTAGKEAAPKKAAAAPTPAQDKTAADPDVASSRDAPKLVAQLQDPEISGPAAPSPATEPTKADAEVEVEATRPSFLSRFRLRTKIVAGTAGALLLSGVVFSVLARSAENDLNDPGRGCFTDTEVARCKDLERSADNRALTANLLFAAGGAAAVGAGTLVYLDLSKGKAGARLAMNF